ncbi:kinase-like protein [Lophiostoma macrostomum CBS 122681]|uniref:non-specific serine/threonine protein kinase n=1 Tax=Lophiostoma macrostomum CBS 122681 TaxID=1314788 RepID=A0A6A6TN75_9PLEO|nr:kinase-like protein [Lophiostoma macrostomum CBS 122681]
MVSRESSASEGEIVEATHKANTAASHSREPGIDNFSRGFGLDGASDVKDRHYRRASRSPSPYRRKIERSPSPYRRDRDRSPSPFRHGRDSRGLDSKPLPSHKRKASPHRHGRPEKRYNADKGRSHGRRHQTYQEDRTGSRQTGSFKDSENGTDRTHNSRISYADTEPVNPVPSFRDQALAPLSTSGHNGNVKTLANGHGVDSSTSTLKPADKAGMDASRDQNGSTDVKMIDRDEPEPLTLATEEQVPSQESREEKKRRWAAKRAQLASNHESARLLQQAVIANASEATTPNVGSPAVPFESSASPPAGSPRLPDMDSVPPSPDVMVVDKQEDVTEGVGPQEDGPSAATYDPTQDMLDDRFRAEQRAQQSDMSANAYDETNPTLLSTLPAEKAKPAKMKRKEIDMFAFSDDEEFDDAGDEQVEGDIENGPTKGTVLDAKLLDNWDDPDGYYKIISNELVNAGRYRMVKGLGRGVFANVAQAEDVQSGAGQLVAIKIVRRNDAMRKASQKEMEFLRRLNDADPQDKRHIIRLLSSFDHKGHFCIVFEHMSKNLRDLLKEETSGHGLSLQAVKTYARQMFSGLKHLQECDIIHADLKPDNILVSLDKKTVKLCDLGTAADKRDNSEPTPYLVSRFYRSPEIILGMEIGHGIDMWAIGCTIYELWTGKILFPGRSNNQMVKVIMECLGWPSEKLLKKGELSVNHFEAGPPLKLVSREVDQLGNPFIRKIEQHRMASRSLKTRVHEATRGITGNGPTTTELTDFVDLITACLNWNFEKRIEAKDAVNHRFFVSKTLAPRSAVVKPIIPKRGVNRK